MKVILIISALLAVAFVVDHFDSGTNQAALSTPLPTNPIMRARVEQNLGDLTNALGDLREIPPDSPDYREAQQMIALTTEEQSSHAQLPGPAQPPDRSRRQLQEDRNSE